MDYLKKETKLAECGDIAMEIIPETSEIFDGLLNKYARALLENILAFAMERKTKTNAYIDGLIDSSFDELRLNLSNRNDDLDMLLEEKSHKILSCVVQIIKTHTREYDGKKQF